MRISRESSVMRKRCYHELSRKEDKNGIYSDSPQANFSLLSVRIGIRRPVLFQ